MKTLIALVALGFFVLPVTAQDGSDPGPELTKARAESFVACLRDIIEIGKKYEGEEEIGLFGNQDTDVESAIEALSQHPAWNELQNALTKNGFESPEEWGQASRRFMAAYAAVKLEGQDSDMNAQMREAIVQIRENTMLTDEQKEQMIEMINAQQELFGDMQDDTSNADKEAVRSVIDDFEKLSEKR